MLQSQKWSHKTVWECYTLHLFCIFQVCISHTGFFSPLSHFWASQVRPLWQVRDAWDSHPSSSELVSPFSGLQRVLQEHHTATPRRLTFHREVTAMFCAIYGEGQAPSYHKASCFSWSLSSARANSPNQWRIMDKNIDRRHSDGGNVSARISPNSCLGGTASVFQNSLCAIVTPKTFNHISNFDFCIGESYGKASKSNKGSLPFLSSSGCLFHLWL